MRWLIVGALWGSAWGVMHAQEKDSAFIARARQATERFKDISVAVSESYVKVGPDFPAMGEHWVNGELIMKAKLDPARPAILTYISRGGERVLTGAVYALALRPGEQPPAAFGGAQWHDHVGSVDEESLLFGHDRVSGADDLRLVVMHAWLWAENPDGMFATDNWRLPFSRLGLRPPTGVSVAAARAAFLVSERDDFFARLFTSAGELGEDQSATVRTILERHRAEVRQWWEARSARAELTLEETRWLEERWQRIESDVYKAVGQRAATRLRHVLSH